MLTIHRILSSANQCKQKTVGKPRNYDIYCAHARMTVHSSILVKDEFNKNNNVCVMHIPMEYLSSSFKNLFGTYLNALRNININNSYQQLL